MSRLARRAVLLVSLAAMAVGVSACGPAAMVTGMDEGSYLKAGNLVYQVQLSRELNPASTEDRAYLEGLPVLDQSLGPSQEWFAVFVKVLNRGNRPAASASSFEIRDTLGHVYRPVSVSNQYDYRPQLVPPGGQVPVVDSAANYAPTNGALLLFKLSDSAYQDRPLDLTIAAPGSPPATVELDL